MEASEGGVAPFFALQLKLGERHLRIGDERMPGSILNGP